MRVAALAFLAVVGFGAEELSVQAAPIFSAPDAKKPDLSRVAEGCGWGYHYVPGHWSRWRGEWVPPHCAPIAPGVGPGYYGGGGYTYPSQYYEGGYPYGYGYRRWYGY